MQSNAAERKQVRRAEKQARVDDRARREITSQLMSTTPGRAWMLGYLEFCHCFHSSFTGNPQPDAFNEGQRSVGLKLLDDIMRTCPDDYVLMMKERNIRDTADGRHNAGNAVGELTGGSWDGWDTDGPTDRSDDAGD